jgi:hypothetical protein
MPTVFATMLPNMAPVNLNDICMQRQA